MHVFLAGATGAVGRALVPLLLSNGHTVTGTTRSAQKAAQLRAAGADAVVLDGLDRAAVIDAVTTARPDAIVHQMTALANIDFRHFDRSFVQTVRLRTEGTDHLLEAARLSGVERIVAQSYFAFAREGGPVKREDAPLDPEPPAQMRRSVEAIRHVERVVPAAGGIVLRYGGFYGPGTSVTPGAEQWEAVRARKFPLVGDAGGVWSFLHVEDAASATLAALERARAGEIYNVSDDDPAPVREWLPALAAAAGGKPPRSVPRWLGRLLAGEHMVMMMCELRGGSNAKIKRELGWTPAWPTWREGFAALARRPSG
jgi:nucleoside-diphosphate-sugar epimerase